MGKYSAVGNTVAPAELRWTKSGLPVCNVTVAETTRRFDKQANEWVDDSTTFWRCTVWGKSAEPAVESLTDKGVRVVVVGDVKTRTWTTRTATSAPRRSWTTARWHCPPCTTR